MHIGVIGTGNIGGMLARVLAGNPDTEVYVFNRTLRKATALAEAVPDLTMLTSARDVAKVSDVVFVCTKPQDGTAVLREIGPFLRQDQLLVVTVSSWHLEDIEGLTCAGVAKVIPSIVQHQRSGIMLVEHGPSLPQSQRRQLESLLATMSTPFVVAEDQLRVASDLASCGPAFLAYLLKQWAETAARTGKLSYAEAEHLLQATLVGVAALLQSGMTLRDVIDKVAVPGGVTETGIASLEATSAHVFEQLHEATANHGHGTAIGNATRK
jgi:competence protein ComER